MRYKLMLILIVAILLSMILYSAGDISMIAHASESSEQGNLNIVDATVDGEVIRVSVENNKTGEDSKLELNLSDYTTDSEYISIQAVDLEGNKSNIVEIKNPNYKPVEKTADEKTESSIPPASTSSLKPLTPDGSGTVVDNVSESDGKEFYTINTEDENTFYLVIDKEKSGDNVYFLNAVTESDLLSLAEKGSDKSPTGNVSSFIPTAEPSATPTPTPTSSPEPVDTSKKGNGGTTIFIILALLAAGGAGYYFKIYLPKQQGTDSEDEEEYDNDYNNGYNSSDDESDEDYDDEDLEDENDDGSDDE